MKPYYQDSAVTLYCGDCREILPSLGEVDHTITDPPYGERTNNGARNCLGSESPITYDAMDVKQVAQLIPAWVNISRRWVIVWCDIESIGALSDADPLSYVRAGFWRKPDATPQFTGDRPAMAGEACAIFHRPGKKRWNGGGHAAYWEAHTERERLGHPTPKPILLIRKLVTQFTDHGETILDPFAGSGTTGRAAKDLGRKAVLIEREERYCEIAARRMEQEVLPIFSQPEPKMETPELSACKPA